jgi:H+/Cl- antiporter ClcA
VPRPEPPDEPPEGHVPLRRVGVGNWRLSVGTLRMGVGPWRAVALTIAVGVVGGGVGAAYVSTLRALQRLLWPDHHSSVTQIGILAGAGLVVAACVRFLGEPGDVELLVDNIHVSGGSRDLRALRSLIPASLVGIAAGSALGPEAPLVQTGGTLGTAVARWGGAEHEHVRVLTITGMASAFSVLFGAPLGSAVFALEILHRRGLEYYEALLPALTGSLIGFVVYTCLEGAGYGPVFQLPEAHTGAASDLGWALVAATVGAVLAGLFTLLVGLTRRMAERIPRVARPMLGGVAIGLLGLWSTGALTFGEHQITGLAVPEAAVGTLVAALVCKLVASAVCVSTGWKGGFIIPMFFIGAAAGQLLHAALPGVDATMLMTACMVATNVGVTKTPVGSALVVTEMAGVRLLPTSIMAAVVAMALTSEVHVIHTQRARTRA